MQYYIRFKSIVIILFHKIRKCVVWLINLKLNERYMKKIKKNLKLYLHNFDNIVIAIKQQQRVILSNDSQVKLNHFDHSL
jgi:hypothetical protein